MCKGDVVEAFATVAEEQPVATEFEIIQNGKFFSL
jgi:hypothetical protein